METLSKNGRQGEKNQNLCGKLEWVLFAVYVLFLVVVACFHEPWYDEAEAWQMARGAGFHDLLFYIPHYEGHPALWYLILAIPAKLGVPYELGLKGISCAAAVLYGWLLLFRAPFPKVIRCVLPFHYFFFYQYGVISRPYGLSVLCLLLMAIAFRKREERPFRFLLPMAFLCALSGYGIVLSGGICIAWLWDICRQMNWKLISAKFWKDKRILGMAALLVLAILLILEIMPYADTYATSRTASNSLLLRLIYSVFLMLPDSTVLTILEGAAFLSKAQIALPILLVGILIGGIMLTALVSTASFRNLPYFVIPYCLFSVFAAVVYFCAHHMGMCLAFAVFWLWISLEDSHRFEVGKRLFGKLRLEEQDRITLKKVGKLALAILILVPLYWSAAASVLDIALPYYYGRDMARFLKDTGLSQARIMGEYDITLPEETDENTDIYAYLNTQLIARPIGALPYFDHNIILNLNMGKDSGGYALHRLPASAENKAVMEEWRKLGLPDVVIGPMNLVYVFGEEAAGVEYVPVYEYRPFANIWKAFLSKYNIVYKEFIYLRSDLLEQYGLTEIDPNAQQ